MPGKLQRESGAQHPASGRGFEGGVHGAVTFMARLRPKEIAKLRAKAEYLEERGGKVVLTECGTKKRLCAEIDLGAGEYGEDGQFRILKGY